MKDITASRLALLFHEAYERLAPDFGYETRAETRFFNVDSPNGKLMIAVSREVLLELRTTPEEAIMSESAHYSRASFLDLLAERDALKARERELAEILDGCINSQECNGYIGVKMLEEARAILAKMSP